MDTELTLWAIQRERRIDARRSQLASCARSAAVATAPHYTDRVGHPTFVAACWALMADPLHRRRPV